MRDSTQDSTHESGHEQNQVYFVMENDLLYPQYIYDDDGYYYDEYDDYDDDDDSYYSPDAAVYMQGADADDQPPGATLRRWLFVAITLLVLFSFIVYVLYGAFGPLVLPQPIAPPLIEPQFRY